jgi:undecaprenyl-diphosphatase
VTLWEALVLGVIQGVFMFFPVSSTGHLVLVQHLLTGRGAHLPAPDSPEMILFDLVVHVGTVVSIIVVFRSGLARLVRGTLADTRFALSGTRSDAADGPSPEPDRLYLRLVVLGLVAVAVTGLIGLVVRAFGTAAFATTVWVAFALAITGAILMWTDVCGPRWRGLRDITLVVAVGIGAAQGLALLPGLSRSGLTIAAALALGLTRRRSAQFSFYLAIPTILAASIYQAVAVARAGAGFEISPGAYAVGFAVAALVGIVALKLVLAALYRARFRYFAYYVWVLAAVVLFVDIPGF